ncbi:hypothetical protein B0H66DRAFT_617779 [Apodospora peruviana]|uniref:Fungal N-terminal domain-containing protein n=1 Tax=Apodospora peruviana TaxID=516989 RepID=A0AAE0MBS9_9PEZI|nr:hypothetical protein B0H66DRAFT_617779 [Apodospora peruviana]
MTDPVALTLSIAPLCFSAIQGLSILISKLRTFRNHCKEVKHIRRRLRIQNDCFRHELHLLLLKTTDGLTAAAMLSAGMDAQWKSWDLETKLRAYLGDRYDLFKEAVEEIQETTSDLRSKLALFAAPTSPSSLSKTAKDAFRMVFKKQGYDESIATLKE